MESEWFERDDSWRDLPDWEDDVIYKAEKEHREDRTYLLEDGDWW